MTKKIIQSIGTTFRYSLLSDNTKVSKPYFYYYVLPSTFTNMKHLLQPPAPAQCIKSSQIDPSENGKYLCDDTKGGASKIDIDHSQNIQSCTCTPQNVEYLRSLVFTPAYWIMIRREEHPGWCFESYNIIQLELLGALRLSSQCQALIKIR